jgi:glucose/arabinose dehydrogenase
MKSFIFLSGAMFVCTLFALSSCSTQDDKAMTPAAPAAPAPAAKAEAKAPPAEAKAEKAGEAKAKATKVVGDVGLLDMEKNYMILVTKEGKLITIDFDPKTTPTQKTQEDSKMADVGLGSSAVVQYQKAGDKLKATSLEYTPAKGE